MTSNMTIVAEDTVYNIKVACNGELRRFAFAGFSFEKLSAQVAQTFGVPKEGFVFQYVDDEGDRITMSSDIELKAAVEIFKGVLRLEVVLKGEAQTKRATHHGRHRNHLLVRKPLERRDSKKCWRRMMKCQKPGLKLRGMRRHCHQGRWAKLAMMKLGRRHLARATIESRASAGPRCWRQGLGGHHSRWGHGQRRHFPKPERTLLDMGKCIGRRHMWRMMAAAGEVAKRPHCAWPREKQGCFPCLLRHGPLHGRRCAHMEKFGGMRALRKGERFGKRGWAWKRPVV